MTTRFDKEELEILNYIQDGEWTSVDKIEEKITEYRQNAVEFLKKVKRINIRLSEKDLIEIQKRAVK